MSRYSFTTEFSKQMTIMKNIQLIPAGCSRIAAGTAGPTLIGAMLAPQLAFAQFTQLSTTLDNLVTVLSGAGVLTVTLAIMWAGYKMVFQHARWADISTIVFGAVFIGGAAALAKYLVGTTS